MLTAGHLSTLANSINVLKTVSAAYIHNKVVSTQLGLDLTKQISKTLSLDNYCSDKYVNICTATADLTF